MTPQDQLAFSGYAQTAKKNIKKHLNMLAFEMRNMDNKKTDYKKKKVVLAKVMELQKKLFNINDPKAIGTMMRNWVKEQRTWKDCLKDIEQEVNTLIEKYKNIMKSKDRLEEAKNRLEFSGSAQTAKKHIEEHLNMLACKMRKMDKKQTGFKRNTPETKQILAKVMELRKMLTNTNDPTMQDIGSMMRWWGNKHMGHLVRMKNSGKNCYHPVYGNLRY